MSKTLYQLQCELADAKQKQETIRNELKNRTMFNAPLQLYTYRKAAKKIKKRIEELKTYIELHPDFNPLGK